MILKHCTYVLYSLKDHKLYIGSSSNLAQRLKAHANGGVASTAPRRPLELVFCEYFLSKADSVRRESYFKTTAGKKGLKLVIRESLREMEPT